MFQLFLPRFSIRRKSDCPEPSKTLNAPATHDSPRAEREIPCRRQHLLDEMPNPEARPQPEKSTAFGHLTQGGLYESTTNWCSNFSRHPCPPAVTCLRFERPIASARPDRPCMSVRTPALNFKDRVLIPFNSKSLPIC